MSTGEYDYTQGEGVPESALNADDLVIGGSGAIDHDPNKSEQENLFNDLEPGHYLLKIVGFGKAEPKLKTAYINGQPVSYTAIQLEVRFADTANPTGRIRNYFSLPPETDAELAAYNHGTNAAGKAEGFMAKVFDHFLDRLFPGEAYSVDQRTGRKVMSPKARALSNWKGRLIWAEVAPGQQDVNKVNPTTGDPYPPRNQIRLFSFKPHVEGGPSPFPASPARPGQKPANGTVRTQPVRPVATPAAAMAAAGIDAI